MAGRTTRFAAIALGFALSLVGILGIGHMLLGRGEAGRKWFVNGVAYVVAWLLGGALFSFTQEALLLLNYWFWGTGALGYACMLGIHGIRLWSGAPDGLTREPTGAKWLNLIVPGAHGLVVEGPGRKHTALMLLSMAALSPFVIILESPDVHVGNEWGFVAVWGLVFVWLAIRPWLPRNVPSWMAVK